MLTLISNARVYAPASMGVQHLLIGGGRILWMGEQSPDISAALLGEHYDAGGRRLLPGFIDGHAHLTGGGGESGFASRVPPLELSRFTSVGVTSVVGLLGTDDTTRDTNALLAQTRALREEGLNAYCYTGGYHVPPTTLTGSVRGDIVHLDPVIGVGELAISDHRSSQPTLDELLRIASDAHVAGMMTGKAGILHLHLGDGERGLQLIRDALQISEIPARVFNPTHINRRQALFDEACELAGRGCYVDLTAFPVEDGEDAWSAADGLRRYLDRGAPPERITVSSDGGGCLPHFDNDGRIVRMEIGQPSSMAETLAELLNADCALQTVLPAFTTNAANLLRLTGKGVVASGFDADLIILDDDHSVSSVMLGGDWHRLDGQQQKLGLFEHGKS